MSLDKELTLLYIDDEEINNFLFVHNFTMYNVITAMSGQAGLDILRDDQVAIDAVVSDMSMPIMNGVEFIKEAKKLHPNTPFYILTAYSSNEEIATALKSKLINKCFVKPLNVDKIRQNVEKDLAGKG